MINSDASLCLKCERDNAEICMTFVW